MKPESFEGKILGPGSASEDDPLSRLNKLPDEVMSRLTEREMQVLKAWLTTPYDGRTTSKAAAAGLGLSTKEFKQELEGALRVISGPVWDMERRKEL